MESIISIIAFIGRGLTELFYGSDLLAKTYLAITICNIA
jgi:hypothetical protein